MLAFVIVLVCLAAAVQFWSLRHALDGVEHHVAPDRKLAEPDEPFALVRTVTNRSRRFIPYVQVSQVVPPELSPLDDRAELQLRSQSYNVLSCNLWLMPRQTWQQSLPVSLSKRGRYVFVDTTLRAGGFLGLDETVEYVHQYEEMVIIPALCRAPKLDATLGGFLGDRSVDRFILEDPVLTLGFREYTGREPMKSISWTQSARAGQLMVKKYDYTLELTATVLLNIDTDRTAGWEQRLETCFSLARTVCEALEEKQIPYRFVTNAGAAGALSQWSQVGDGLGSGHLATILEGLGRATYEPLKPFVLTLEQTARHAEQGRTHILITPQRDGDWLPALNRLEQLTGTPTLILTPEEVLPL